MSAGIDDRLVWLMVCKAGVREEEWLLVGGCCKGFDLKAAALLCLRWAVALPVLEDEFDSTWFFWLKKLSPRSRFEELWGMA